MNLKKIIQEIDESPNLRPYYREKFQPMVAGTRICRRNVLIMYKKKVEESEDLREFVPADSDDDV